MAGQFGRRQFVWRAAGGGFADSRRLQHGGQLQFAAGDSCQLAVQLQTGCTQLLARLPQPGQQWSPSANTAMAGQHRENRKSTGELLDEPAAGSSTLNYLF